MTYSAGDSGHVAVHNAIDVTQASVIAAAAASAASAAAAASLVGAPADVAVAAIVGDPASDTATLLSSTYVPQAASLAHYGSPPIGSKFDASTLIAPNAASALAITTYVGGNNDVVEPSVYYNPNGWNGFEYWMVAGPYENANAIYENPSIWASHDGLTWVTPPGGSAPAIPAPASGNYDDPYLFELSGTMYLVWNWGHGANDVLLSTSTDGITWSAPSSIIQTAGQSLTSPRLLNFMGSWHLWTLDITTSPHPVILRKAATIAGIAAASPTTCTAAVPTGKDNWEFEVKRVGSEWWMLHCLVNTGGTAQGGVLYLRTSQDGLTWTLPSRPILTANLRNGSAWDATFIYKSGFVPLLDGRVAIWYNGAGGSRWKIGYTVAARPSKTPLRSTSWYAPQTAVTTAIMIQGDANYVPVYFDGETTLSAIGLEVTTVGTAGSVVRLGVYQDDGKGVPGSLLLDAGTIDGTTTNTGAPQTISTPGLVVGPGVVWFAAAGQGSPATQPVVRMTTGVSTIPISATTASLVSQNALNGQHYASAAGAFASFAADQAGGLGGKLSVARVVYQVA